MVSQKAGSPGRSRISRKAIAQGRPDASAKPVCSGAAFLCNIAHETAGAARTRSSLRPLNSEGEVFGQILGRLALEYVICCLKFERLSGNPSASSLRTQGPIPRDPSVRRGG